MPEVRGLAITNIAKLVTCEPRLFDSSDREAEAIGLIDDACVVVRAGHIEWVGRQEELVVGDAGVLDTIDAHGMVVLPGLVDAHTHAVFAGTREKEYEMRVAGATYMEIANRGGGINSTVESVRRASEDELVEIAKPRLHSMLRRGTTTVEIKSGYGLDLESELKMLRAIKRLGEETELDVVATFLGAHEIPPEHRKSRERYIDILTKEMIPAVSQAGLAEFCDVFCEEGVFSPDESRRILECGTEHGLKPKIHADELKDTGGAQVAADVGAISAGHLAFASGESLAAMRDAGTVAVLLPGVSLGLAKPQFADARSMLDMGLEVAVATDFNPGSSMVDSLLIVSGLACSFMKMLPRETLLGVTAKAAKAVDRHRDIGAVTAGKRADLVFFDIPDFRYLPYHFGGEMVKTVMKSGEIVFEAAVDG